MGQYAIRLSKQAFNFDSAHFVTFLRQCEHLHGHNYHVQVEIAGNLTPDGFVYDFLEVKPVIKRVCDTLDHRVLLARANPHLSFEHTATDVRVTFGDRGWTFPRDEVVELPIANTTAELLASYLAGQIKAELADVPAGHFRTISVEVSESPGQSAVYTEDW